MRLGILGGTFNPPHLGHLICAEAAFEQLELDRVLIVPTGVPPHKPRSRDDPGAEARLQLCRAATAGDERFEVSAIEVERPGPSYTVDTLRMLHERSPDTELFFIVGGDAAASLPRWRDPEGILGLATLAIARRSGTSGTRLRAVLSGLRGGERSRTLRMPQIGISSSLVRSRVQAGRSIRYLVPQEVASLIAAESLYPPVPSPDRMTPESLLAEVAELAADRKALDIVGLDLRGMLGYTDYFVICSGRSDRQVKAIHDGIHEGLKREHGLLPRRVEGVSQAHWVLMDYLDVIVHVFTPEKRDFYRLEQLWGEAERVDLGTPQGALTGPPAA